MEQIVDELRPQVKAALLYAVQSVAPDLDVDSQALFRAFKRKVRSKRGTWARMRDAHVDKDE